MPACPIHHVATTDSPWDGAAAESALVLPEHESMAIAVGNAEFAFRDPDADATTKAAWWGPHHMVGSDGKPGAANIKACTSVVAILNGAMGGPGMVPELQRRAVWQHVTAHLQDAGLKDSDLPELKSHKASGADIRRELRGTPESRVSPRSEFELREVDNGTGGTDLKFGGFASVTGAGAAYEMEDFAGPWVEWVSVGAFGKTISQECDTALLLNHSGMSLARTKSGTLRLSEVTDGRNSPVAGVTGLHSEARLDPKNFYVAAMRSAVERGDLDEMSMAFRVLRNDWTDEYTRRNIQEVSLDKGDVSLVNYAASPATGGTVSVRQRFPGRVPVLRRDDSPVNACNRCAGEGSIVLQSGVVSCPLCKGSGTGENNATVEQQLALYRDAQDLSDSFRRDRLRLEQLRYYRPRPGLTTPTVEPPGRSVPIRRGV